jgi:hypothetical protein
MQDSKSITIKVDIAEGQPPLDLVYELGEDPFAAAERFIQANHLPIGHLQTVAEFIVQNVPQARTRVPAATTTAVKKKHNGVEYDYVFDIGTDDGRDLQLPYNTGESATSAAQRFIDENKLPIEFLEKVTTFILSQVRACGQALNCQCIGCTPNILCRPVHWQWPICARRCASANIRYACH